MAISTPSSSNYASFTRYFSFRVCQLSHTITFEPECLICYKHANGELVMCYSENMQSAQMVPMTAMKCSGLLRPWMVTIDR